MPTPSICCSPPTETDPPTHQTFEFGEYAAPSDLDCSSRRDQQVLADRQLEEDPAFFREQPQPAARESCARHASGGSAQYVDASGDRWEYACDGPATWWISRRRSVRAARRSRRRRRGGQTADRWNPAVACDHPSTTIAPHRHLRPQIGGDHDRVPRICPASPRDETSRNRGRRCSRRPRGRAPCRGRSGGRRPRNRRYRQRPPKCLLSSLSSPAAGSSSIIIGCGDRPGRRRRASAPRATGHRVPVGDGPRARAVRAPRRPCPHPSDRRTEQIAQDVGGRGPVERHRQVLATVRSLNSSTDCQVRTSPDAAPVGAAAARDVATAERDSTCCRREARHRVDEAGLARPVRTDQPHDLAFPDSDVDVVVGDDATETNESHRSRRTPDRARSRRHAHRRTAGNGRPAGPHDQGRGSGGHRSAWHPNAGQRGDERRGVADRTDDAVLVQDRGEDELKPAKTP